MELPGIVANWLLPNGRAEKSRDFWSTLFLVSRFLCTRITNRLHSSLFADYFFMRIVGVPCLAAKYHVVCLGCLGKVKCNMAGLLNSSSMGRPHWRLVGASWISGCDICRFALSLHNPRTCCILALSPGYGSKKKKKTAVTSTGIWISTCLLNEIDSVGIDRIYQKWALEGSLSTWMALINFAGTLSRIAAMYGQWKGD